MAFGYELLQANKATMITVARCTPHCWTSMRLSLFGDSVSIGVTRTRTKLQSFYGP